MTNFEKVGLFMKTFGQEVKTNASFSSNKINKLRIDLIEEELEELKHAINKKDLKEGFASCANYEKHKTKFTKPTKNNPLMNVLLPEISDKPKRKPAAPSFNRTVEKQINEKAGNVGPDPRLFLDLGDSISFEQSMRNFYSTPNTKVCNDQTAFAKFLYGDMPSCKEGNEFQCTKDNQRYTLF